MLTIVYVRRVDTQLGAYIKTGQTHTFLYNFEDLESRDNTFVR